MNIPQLLGYARIAGMPVVTGLYRFHLLFRLPVDHFDRSVVENPSLQYPHPRRRAPAACRRQRHRPAAPVPVHGDFNQDFGVEFLRVGARSRQRQGVGRTPHLLARRRQPMTQNPFARPVRSAQQAENETA